MQTHTDGYPPPRESLLFTTTYYTSGGSREGARALIFKPNCGGRVENNFWRPLSRGLDLASCTIQILYFWYVRMLTVTLFSFANVLLNLSLPKFLQLSQALRVFSLHARGPAFEHYAAQFQDECNKVTYYLDRNLFLWRPPFWSKLWQFNCKVALAA